MNQLQFDVSAKAFQKSLQERPNMDDNEETAEQVVEKKVFFSLRHLFENLNNKKKAKRGASLPHLKNKTA